MCSSDLLGVPKVKRIGFGMMEGVIWHQISEERRKKFEAKVRAFAREFQHLAPEKKSLKATLYFQICKRMQQSVLKKIGDGEKPSVDTQYWIDQGWISG